MAIRKHGVVTGEVTGVEGAEDRGMAKEAALVPLPDWDFPDDQALADENQAADG